MKFLERAGDSAGAKYSNTPTTALYLDRQSPRYIGGILEMLNARLFKYWHDLPEALGTGQPQNETKHGEKSIFDQLYADTTKLEQFLDELLSRQPYIPGSVIPQNGSPEHVLRVDHSGQLV
jgi:hypothetical protein